MNEIDDGYMLVAVDGVLQRRRIEYYRNASVDTPFGQRFVGIALPVPELHANEILETTFDGTRRICTVDRGY